MMPELSDHLYDSRISYLDDVAWLGFAVLSSGLNDIVDAFLYFVIYLAESFGSFPAAYIGGGRNEGMTQPFA